MRPTRLIPLLFALAACTKGNAPANDSSSVSAGTDSMSAASSTASDDAARDAIGKVRTAWQEAANRNDPAAVAAMYTDDATFVGTESPLASGRQEIQSAFAKTFPIAKIESIDSKELVVNGDMAYDYGTFRQQVTPPNAKAMTINGYYLVITHRQSDGSWKISHHVSTTPPAKP